MIGFGLGFAHRRGRRVGRRAYRRRRTGNSSSWARSGRWASSPAVRMGPPFSRTGPPAGASAGLDRCCSGLGRRRAAAALAVRSRADRLRPRRLCGFGRSGILDSMAYGRRSGNLIGKRCIAFPGHGLPASAIGRSGRGRPGVVVGGGRKVERGLAGRRTGREQNREKRGRYGTARSLSHSATLISNRFPCSIIEPHVFCTAVRPLRRTEHVAAGGNEI